MATISLGIRKTMPNADGSFGIKVVIGAMGAAAYISTRYKIDNLKQWKDGRVVKHPDADYINKQLKKILWEFEEVLDAMPNTDAPATAIRQYLLANHRKSDSLKDYAEAYIARLENEGRKSYANNMSYTLKYLLAGLGENVALQSIGAAQLEQFERYMRKRGASSTSINIRMTHFKALLNAAVNDGTVEYRIFPFRGYKMPTKNVRDIWITKEELRKLREAVFSGVSERRHTVARDLFMLSFYFAGINLTDLMDARLDGDTITFVRKKTANKKTGERATSLTIQPEARAIIDKYITADGRLDFSYHYRDYEQFRSFVTKSLNRIGEELGFDRKLMYYSARKTFVQFGTDLGIPLYVLEYAVGQTIKDANNRPIHDYFRTMRPQADMAVRAIISYSQDLEEETAPIPEWARKYIMRK